MRLKNSEKKLLALLISSLAVGGFFNYVFFPLYDNYSLLKEQAGILNKEHSDALSSELSDAQLKTMITDAFNRYESLKIKMPIYSHQEDAILHLTSVSSKHQLNIQQYQFEYSDTDEAKFSSTEDPSLKAEDVAPISDVLNEFSKLVKGDASANVDQYKDSITPDFETASKEGETVNGKTAQAKSPYEESLSYLNVNLRLEGSYNNFKAFISEIESYKNTVIITQININKDAEKQSDIIGSISLSYPYFTDFENIDPSQSTFKASAKPLNPFDYTVKTLSTVPQGSTDNASEALPIAPEALIPLTPLEPETKTSATDIISSSDFHMTLKPMASDASTTTIGKSPFRYSELYSSVAGQEVLALTLIKKEGAYLFQYSNNTESYPGGNEYLPLIPMSNGKLVMAVQSQGRLPSGDQSSVLLQIKNTTGLPLEIYVFGDDKKRPRFLYKKVSGTTKVIKE